MNLLERLVLSSLQWLCVHGELKSAPPADRTIQAKVELKLRSEAHTQSEGGRHYPLMARAEVVGTFEGEADRVEVFSLALTLRATYRLHHGEPISDETFSEHHGTLARQIYPLMHMRLNQLLLELGIPHVTLPPDLAHPNHTSLAGTMPAEGQLVH